MNQYSQTGFYSLVKGEYWRILTSRIAFDDTKNAILAALLCYYFRVFERRWGTKRYASRLLTIQLLSTLFQVLITYLVSMYAFEEEDPFEFLSVGPVAPILSLFVFFFHDIPKPKSGSFTSNIISPKSLVYFTGFHIMSSSKANLISALSGILSGLIVRGNILASQHWIPIPKFISSLCYRLFGRWIASSSQEQGIMGATLEAQRVEQVEAMEQQMQRMYLGRAGRHRAHVGQGFAERLVNEGEGGRRGVINWGPFQVPNNNAVQARHTPPSEENIRLLMDMGFTRERVVQALTQSNNDVQLATTVLLQET